MDAREAYLRRAYRVALLITDSSAEAGRVLRRVATLLPNPERTSDARFDRAVIQASRPAHEAPDRAPSDDGLASLFTLDEPARLLWRRVHALQSQEREAWVLRVLEGLDDVCAARAMDCSRHALETIHLRSAEAALRASAQGDYDVAADGLRRALEGLDATDAIARLDGVLRRHQRRSTLVTLASALALLVFFGVLLFVLFDLLAWEDSERAISEAINERFSNPMPERDEGDEP